MDRGPLARLTFGVRDFAPTVDGSTFVAEARAHGQLVALRVKLAPILAGGRQVAEMGEPQHRLDVEFRSLGEPTDALLAVLAARFEIAIAGGSRARPTLRMDGAALRGDPADPAREKLRFRLFFPSRHDRETDPFELLGSLDLGAGEFSLVEKWDAYRPVVVRALAYVPARDAN